MGGVLTSTTAQRISCSVVAGAANNVLGDTEAAPILRSREILYVPDVVANAGGAIHSVGRESLGWTDAQVGERTRRIGETVGEVVNISDRNDVSTDVAAKILARRRVDDARAHA